MIDEDKEFLKKGKAFDIKETSDSVWFELHPEDLTLKHIDCVFDIYDQLYAEELDDFFSYDEQMKNGELSFFKDTENYLAYFIFTRSTGHVMLRKLKEWKPKKDELLKRFHTF